MFKKIITGGIGVLTAVLMLGSTVEAATGSISGTSASSCVCYTCAFAKVSCSLVQTTSCAPNTYKTRVCSVGVESTLQGLGNTFQGANFDPAAYNVILTLQDVRLQCRNKAGNSVNANAPHFVGISAQINETDQVHAGEVKKNGRALSDVLFTDEAILGALPVVVMDDACPNKNNWTLVPLVERMQLLGRLYRDTDTTSNSCLIATDLNGETTITETVSGACLLADALKVQCTAPDGAVAGTSFDYTNCTTICHNSAGINSPCSIPPLPSP